MQQLLRNLYEIYYHDPFDFASILWEEFVSHVNHSKKALEVASAHFWTLFFEESYEQLGIYIQANEEMVSISSSKIPKVVRNQSAKFL